jgi:hypothetical protein
MEGNKWKIKLLWVKENEGIYGKEIEERIDKEEERSKDEKNEFKRIKIRKL